MRTKEKLKQTICEAVDRRRGEIEKIGDHIMANPELGFKEFKTAKLVADTLKSFDIPHETGLAITGVKGVIRGKNSGPTVALMGELDSLLVSDHPQADSETGAAHACGHNAQIAGLMGAMMGLVDSRAMDELCGNIVIFAVPAEECTEAGHRTGSTDMGDISHIMPAVHPSMSGASGISHGNDFMISDKEMAYMAPAKALGLMAVDLLYGNAEKAKEIMARHRPIMSKEEYLSYQNRIFQKEIFDGETGTSTKLKV